MTVISRRIYSLNRKPHYVHLGECHVPDTQTQLKDQVLLHAFLTIVQKFQLSKRFTNLSFLHYFVFCEYISRTSSTINPSADSHTRDVHISKTVLVTSHFVACYGLFTLHGSGTRTGTGNGTRTIENPSLHQTSVNILTLYYTFHLYPAPDLVPFPYHYRDYFLATASSHCFLEPKELSCWPSSQTESTTLNHKNRTGESIAARASREFL